MPFKPVEHPKCPKCGKSVYAAEEMVAGGYKWHKFCFKCTMCNKLLDSTNCCEHQAELYCKQCHGRKYGPKGVGFGLGAGALTMDSGEKFGNKREEGPGMSHLAFMGIGRTRLTKYHSMVSVSRFSWIVLGLVIFLPGNVVLDKPKATRNVEITADDEKLRDPEGYEAIKELHRLMDDDQSGSIDRFESNDFLQEDMKLTGSDRARRERAFHHDDDAITVDDMWESWFESEERSWNEQHLLDWLINIVKLPQYEKTFTEHKVTGISLPRMAIQNSSFLISILGIKNFVHRQKLQLKALDLVLFGFQEPSGSRFKDAILLVLTLVCIVLGYVLTKFRAKSQQQVTELTKKLTELKSMESEFEGAQKRFDSQDEVDGESVLSLKSKLEEAERRLEMTGESMSFSIQPLLRRTYELEIGCINEKKMECLQEMKEAKEFVDRMRKRQGNLFNSIKLATGATALETDTIDAKVFSLKQRMEKLKSAMDECQQRWIEIENLCGFSITGSSYDTGLEFQRVPSNNRFKTAATVAALSSYQLRVPGIEVQYGARLSDPHGFVPYCDCSSASSSSDDAEI